MAASCIYAFKKTFVYGDVHMRAHTRKHTHTHKDTQTLIYECVCIKAGSRRVPPLDSPPARILKLARHSQDEVC